MVCAIGRHGCKFVAVTRPIQESVASTRALDPKVVRLWKGHPLRHAESVSTRKPATARGRPPRFLRPVTCDAQTAPEGGTTLPPRSSLSTGRALWPSLQRLRKQV